MNSLSIISIIPARSGSLSISKKNLQKIENKSLIEYAIEASLNCSSVQETFVSSDSQEFLDKATLAGAKIHLRSKENASNDASMLDTIKEFDAFYNIHHRKNIVYLVLYPTYPFRTNFDLEKIISVYKKKQKNYPDGLVGVKPISDHSYLAIDIKDFRIVPIYNPDVNKYYRRQDYPEQHVICHWACLVAARSLNKLNSQLYGSNTFPYLLENSPIDIDTYHDLQLARFMKKNEENFI